MDGFDPWVWALGPRNHSLQRWAVLGRLGGGGLAAEQGQEFHAPILLGSRHAESLLRAPAAGARSTPSSGLSGDFPGLDSDDSGPGVPDCRLYQGIQPAAGGGDIAPATVVSGVRRYLRWLRKPS